MKKILLITAILCFVFVVFAQIQLEKIVVNEDNRVVSRIVIYLSDDTHWSYDADSEHGMLTVTLDNVVNPKPEISKPATGRMVQEIHPTLSGNDLWITIHTSLPYKVESQVMNNPFRIILDLIEVKSIYNYKDNMALAAFYANTGRYYKAGSIYAKLAEKYNDYNDLNFAWGKLLVKQKNYPKAKERLSLIPNDSKYYAKAQEMLANIENSIMLNKINTVDNKTLSNPQLSSNSEKKTQEMLLPDVKKTTSYKSKDDMLKELEKAVAKAESSVTASLAIPDTITQKLSPPETISNNIEHKTPTQSPETVGQPLIFPIWVLGIGILVLLIIVFIFLDIKHSRKKLVWDTPVEKEKVTIGIDEFTSNMIIKLAEKGWNAEEIGRELNLDAKDVKEYLKKIKKRLV